MLGMVEGIVLGSFDGAADFVGAALSVGSELG
jgi:hypothetical protein